MHKLELSIPLFKDIILALQRVICNDDSRPALQYIWFKVTREHLYAYGCNGYQLNRITVNMKSDDEFEFQIKPFYFRLFGWMGMHRVTITATDDGCEVEMPTHYGAVVYKFRKPSGKFVDADKLLDEAFERSTKRFSVNPVLLSNTMLSFNRSKSKDCVSVWTSSVDNKTEPVYMRTQFSGSESMDAIVLPMRTSEDY